MSTLNVTTIQTANGTTDLTLRTGNTSGPVIVVGANGSFTYSNVNSFSVGSNVSVTTSALSIGNSSVNTVANSTTFAINGNNISPVQSFRNKIINGNFDYWQRGTSNTNVALGQYLADRWISAPNGSTSNVSRQSFTLGQTSVPNEPTYFHRTIVTSFANTTAYNVFSQKIESVRTLAGQTATLSFWAKADASKNIAIEFAQYFGTGGSPSSEVNTIGVTTCALTTSWQKFTITTNIPSISGKTLGSDNNDSLNINFWFDAGSTYNSRTNSLGQQSGTFDIAQVQLEAGSVATPFEMRPLGTELALCQRYYSINSGIGDYYATVAGEVFATILPFRVDMRSIPSLSQDASPQTTNITSQTFNRTTKFGTGFQLTATSVVRAYWYGSIIADAEL